MGKKTGFDELIDEHRDSDEAIVGEAGGNVVTNDPDCPGLAAGTMESLAQYVQRYAAVKDELVRCGAETLLAELDSIHAKVKEIMADGGPDLAYDETSNYEAVLGAPRRVEIWDLASFRKALKPSQRSRYIVEAIAAGAVSDGLKNGDLSRATLEQKGAVRVEAGSRALTIRERKKGLKNGRPATIG